MSNHINNKDAQVFAQKYIVSKLAELSSMTAEIEKNNDDMTQDL